MKSSILVLLIIATLTHYSCKKENCYCGVENPQINLPWLNHQLELLSPFPDQPVCLEVYSFIFEKKEYLSIANCKDTPDGMTWIYDCTGNIKFEFGGMSGGPINYGMPNTFTVELYLNHRKLIYITP